MKVAVDNSLCSGCEVCVDTCPEVFEMNDDGVVQAKMTDIPEEYQETCQEAVESCPTEAITLEEE